MFFFWWWGESCTASRLAVCISLLASQNSQHSYGQIQTHKQEQLWVCWVFWTVNNHRSWLNGDIHQTNIFGNCTCPHFSSCKITSHFQQTLKQTFVWESWDKMSYKGLKDSSSLRFLHLPLTSNTPGYEAQHMVNKRSVSQTFTCTIVPR